jgi:hypothetical protein
MSPSDIDYEIILEMSKGIKIITSNDWLPNFHLGNPKLRLKYIKAHHGLNKIIAKQSSMNTVVILPMSDREYLPNDSHTSLLSHGNKPGNPGGRIINDISNLGPGEIVELVKSKVCAII